ncbi:MAG: nitrite/sulfite reductase [Armatimonadota bacterium]
MSEIERIKAEKDGLDAHSDILRAAQCGYFSVHPDDLQRFRWYGLYEQKPKAGHFMLRVKIPGGRLTSAQLSTLADIAEKYGRGFADITTRQNIQFHWIAIENVPDILVRLDSVGLTTTGACGDTVRNVVTCPVAGLHPQEPIDAEPFAEAVTRFFLNNRLFSNLPRKFKIAVTACPCNCIHPEIHDLSAVAVRLNTNGGGQELAFRLLAGGGLSAQPMFAKPMKMLVPPGRLVDVCRAVVEVFRDFGCRQNRMRARLKFLVSDWGIERFEEEVLGRLDWKPSLAEDVLLPLSRTRGNHLGIHQQKQNGLYWVGASVLAGRLQARQMRVLAQLASEAGTGELRTTNQQNVLIPHIPEEKLEGIVCTLEEEGLSCNPYALSGWAVACTGSEFCNRALTETKSLMCRLVQDLEKTVALDTAVRIHVSGCPHGCGQHQIGDIGLQGRLTAIGGARVEAYDIWLGAQFGSNPRFARPTARRVPADQVKHCLERLLRFYTASKAPGESFAEFAWRHTPEELSAVMGVS